MSSLLDKAKGFVADKIADIPKPEASLDRASFKSMTRECITLHSNVSVSNPYSHRLPICEVTYTLKCAGKSGSANARFAAGLLPRQQLMPGRRGSWEGDDRLVLTAGRRRNQEGRLRQLVIQVLQVVQRGRRPPRRPDELPGSHTTDDFATRPIAPHRRRLCSRVVGDG